MFFNSFSGQELHAHVPVHLRRGGRAEHDHRRSEGDPDRKTSHPCLHNLLKSNSDVKPKPYSSSTLAYLEKLTFILAPD